MLYLDGHLVEPEQARIDPRDRGFLLGDGLFETMRAERGRVPFLDRHLDRLEASAAILGIPLPQPRAALAAACLEVLQANGLTNCIAAVRLTLSRGPGPRGLAPPPEPEPTLLITAAPLAEKAPSPGRVVISTIRRNEHSPLSRIKSLNYLDAVLALREARERGADDAILCNTAGRLACASAANLFLVRDGVLLTPSLGEGVLPGITRGLILELASELGSSAEENAIPPSALERAEEVFLTSSLIGVRPLVAADGHPVGRGALGPLTERLGEAYRERLLRS
jgi:branched-chain amino acid aminotransferase